MVKEVADVTGYGWDKVFEMPVREFLSLVVFARDYAPIEAQRALAWRMTH